MKKHRGVKIQKSALGSLAFGVIFSFTSLFIISFVCSLVLIATENPGGSINGVSLAALLITAAVSGFAVSKYKGEGGMKISLICALISAAVILAISLISSGGNISGGIFMDSLCYVLIAAFTAFLGRRREGRRRHR